MELCGISQCYGGLAFTVSLGKLATPPAVSPSSLPLLTPQGVEKVPVKDVKLHQE